MSREEIKRVQREEYIKCAVNPEYFMRKYCKIQHQQKGKVNFNLYPFQERALEEIQENQYNVILKARQMGISTLMAAYALWMMTFNSDKNVLVVALKQAVAKNLVKKTKIMHDNLPNFLRLKRQVDNRLSMMLENESQITAETTTGNSGRSESLSLLIIDEAAFIDGARELWSSIQATLSASEGDAVVLSCVVGDTHVFTDKGVQTIDELSDPDVGHGSYEVEDYFVHGKDRMRKGFLFHSNGEVETKKIETKYSELEASHNHKLYAYKKDGGYGYYRMDELKKGDFINVQSNMQAWGDADKIKNFKPSVSSKIKNVFDVDKINEDLAYLMGLYISEGSSYKVKNEDGELVGGNITFTIKDDVSSVFNSLGLNVSCHDGIHKTVSSKNLIEFLEHVGFDLSQTSSKKEIPARLMKMSKKNLFALLQGIFDGDGNSSNGKVSLSSTSEKLINQVRAILLNAGIYTTKHLREVKDMNKNMSSFSHEYKFKNDCFTLHMSLAESAKYFDSVGFRLKRKQNNDVSYTSNIHNSKDILPGDTEYMKEMFINTYSKAAWSLKKYHDLTVNSIVNKKTPYKSSNVSRTKVSQMVDVLTNEKLEISKNIDDTLIREDNSRWCKIKSIEGGFAKTYDFSLPSLPYDEWDHSVIYNGILGHQTPHNVGNWFHEVWTNAVAGADLEDKTENKEVWKGTGKNDFHPIKLHWSLHPDRDSEWRRIQSKKLPAKKAAREYDCFDGDTRVFTSCGLKPLRDVKIGDRVLSHTGRWNQVTNRQTVNKEACGFTSQFNTKVSYVTPNHRFLDDNQKWVEFRNLQGSISKFPEHVSRQNFVSNEIRVDLYSLCENMETQFSRILVENDAAFHMSDKHKVIHNRFIQPDYDLGYLIGMYLAEGSGDHRQKTFSFDVSDNQDEFWVQKIRNIVESKVGFIKYNKRYQNTTGHLLYSSRIFCHLIDTLVSGNTPHDKHLSEFAYGIANIDFFKGVVDAVFHGDGTCKGQYNFQLNLTSERLVDDIVFILKVILGWKFISKVKLDRPKSQVIEGRSVDACDTQWGVNLLGTKGLENDTLISSIDPDELDHFHNNYEIKNGYSINKNVICVGSEPKTLYDIEVASDHSFVTEHGVVHNCDFESSGDTVIGMDTIREIEKNQVKKPEYKIPVFGQRDFWVWEEPQPNTSYVVSSDVARGDGDDYSTIQVFTTKEVRQVAEYQGRIRPDQLGNLLVRYGTMYNDALVVVERNSYGYGTLRTIIDRGYKNLLYTSNDLHEVDVKSGSNKKVKPGLYTSSKTRPLIVSKMEEYIRKGYPTIHSSRLTEELKTFVWKKNGKPEHISGYHDDLIFAAMFMFWARDTAIRLNGEDVARSKSMIKNIKSKKGSSGVYTSNQKRSNPWVDQNTGQDLGWLL